MDKFSSPVRRVFNTHISSITGLGAIGFLAISLMGLIMFAYADPSSVINGSPRLSQILGVHMVSADLSMPFDWAPSQEPVVVEKDIYISLTNQNLFYVENMRIVGQFKISSGLRHTPTPPGEYTVLKKKPVVDYVGPGYNLPNTKWNLMFKPGRPGNPLNYYIHGAYWHNNFGQPMSHGCINVSYENMEVLYNWADEGTRIHIY